MKTIIITILALGLLSSLCDAQTRVTKDAAGNYVAIKRAVDTSRNAQVAIFTDSKGKAWPVFKSVNGKLFYNRTSKAGNIYKAYLKEQ